MQGAILKTEVIRGLATGWWDVARPDGEIAVLMHGFPDGPDIWDDLAPSLSERFHVVCPFARGVGPSEPAESARRYGTNAFAFDLLSILKAVDPEGKRRILLVGHDLGVPHMWELARLLEKRLIGVVCVSGLSLEQMAGRLKMPEQHLRSWYIYLLATPGLPESALKKMPRTLFGIFQKSGWQGGGSATVDELVEKAGTSVNQYRGMLRQLPVVLSRPARKLAAPALFVWGRRDPFFAPLSKAELAPFARKVTVRCLDAGHWIPKEAPDVLRDVIFRSIEEWDEQNSSASIQGHVPPTSGQGRPSSKPRSE